MVFFTQEKRIFLSTLEKRGFKQKEISRELGMHQSTISRELKRNTKKHKKYHAGDAKRMAQEQKK